LFRELLSASLNLFGRSSKACIKDKKEFWTFQKSLVESGFNLSLDKKYNFLFNLNKKANPCEYRLNFPNSQTCFIIILKSALFRYRIDFKKPLKLLTSFILAILFVGPLENRRNRS
jgi:hypothetical protein